jgi:hypothetical protein
MTVTTFFGKQEVVRKRSNRIRCERRITKGERGRRHKRLLALIFFTSCFDETNPVFTVPLNSSCPPKKIFMLSHQ